MPDIYEAVYTSKYKKKQFKKSIFGFQRASEIFGHRPFLEKVSDPIFSGKILNDFNSQNTSFWDVPYTDTLFINPSTRFTYFNGIFFL